MFVDPQLSAQFYPNKYLKILTTCSPKHILTSYFLSGNIQFLREQILGNSPCGKTCEGVVHLLLRMKATPFKGASNNVKYKLKDDGGGYVVIRTISATELRSEGCGSCLGRWPHFFPLKIPNTYKEKHRCFTDEYSGSEDVLVRRVTATKWRNCFVNYA